LPFTGAFLFLAVAIVLTFLVFLFFANAAFFVYWFGTFDSPLQSKFAGTIAQLLILQPSNAAPANDEAHTVCKLDHDRAHAAAREHSALLTVALRQPAAQTPSVRESL
jgi:hypothetical protein